MHSILRLKIGVGVRGIALASALAWSLTAFAVMRPDQAADATNEELPPGRGALTVKGQHVSWLLATGEWPTLEGLPDLELTARLKLSTPERARLQLDYAFRLLIRNFPHQIAERVQQIYFDPNQIRFAANIFNQDPTEAFSISDVNINDKLTVDQRIKDAPVTLKINRLWAAIRTGLVFWAVEKEGMTFREIYPSLAYVLKLYMLILHENVVRGDVREALIAEGKSAGGNSALAHYVSDMLKSYFTLQDLAKSGHTATYPGRTQSEIKSDLETLKAALSNDQVKTSEMKALIDGLVEEERSELSELNPQARFAYYTVVRSWNDPILSQAYALLMDESLIHNACPILFGNQ